MWQNRTLQLAFPVGSERLVKQRQCCSRIISFYSVPFVNGVDRDSWNIFACGIHQGTNPIKSVSLPPSWRIPKQLISSSKRCEFDRKFALIINRNRLGGSNGLMMIFVPSYSKQINGLHAWLKSLVLRTKHTHMNQLQTTLWNPMFRN